MKSYDTILFRRTQYETILHNINHRKQDYFIEHTVNKILRYETLNPTFPILEEERKLKFLFSHFFVVPKKVLWRA